jgi:hypothetical protein
MAFMGLEPTTDCLIPLIEAIEAQCKGDLTGLDRNAMQWQPPAGGWSVAQVLEHMVIANTLYLDEMRDMVRDAGKSTAPARSWKPSLMGNLLIRTLVPTATRKLPTAGKLEPGPAPEPDVIPRFLGTMRDTADLLWRAKGIDMRKPRMTSPVSSLVRRLNLGDGFVIIVAHSQRHMGQIERVISAPGFPGIAAD